LKGTSQEKALLKSKENCLFLHVHVKIINV